MFVFTGTIYHHNIHRVIWCNASSTPSATHCTLSNALYKKLEMGLFTPSGKSLKKTLVVHVLSSVLKQLQAKLVLPVEACITRVNGNLFIKPEN